MTNQEIDVLLKKYEDIYQTRTCDFNVLTTVHLSENDHTNILCEILNIKDGDKKPFMESFVKNVLGINYDRDYTAKTQIPSIGNDKTGYIDLLLESPETCIVIENKVCGAGDMDYQLLRYYYTYVEPDDHDKDNIIKNDELYNQIIAFERAKTPEYVYIVYLTETMEKHPDVKSLPEKLKSKLRNHYIHISYKDNIYSWLKDYVQPNIKKGKNGDATKSMDLYLHELENILGAKTAQNEWYDQNKKGILVKLGCENTEPVQQFIYFNKKFKELDNASKKKVYNDNIYLLDLKNCVKYYQESIYKGITPDGWSIRCAEGYIDIFPPTWLEKFGGTAKSSVHFSVNKWQDSKPRIELNIHDKAYKKYVIANEKQLEASIKKVLSSFNPQVNCKPASVSCDIVLDCGDMEWNPNDPKAFFDAFVENENIKAFVQLAENDFKQ